MSRKTFLQDAFFRQYYNLLPTLRIHPKKFHVPNRPDICIRVHFLHDIYIENREPEETDYYSFMENLEASGRISGRDYMVNKFLELYTSIRRDGIQKPILAKRVFGKYLQTYNRQEMSPIQEKTLNTTGYQLIQGAHRISISIFLNYDTIAAKLALGKFFRVPNYVKQVDEVRSRSPHLKKCICLNYISE